MMAMLVNIAGPDVANVSGAWRATHSLSTSIITRLPTIVPVRGKDTVAIRLATAASVQRSIFKRIHLVLQGHGVKK